MSKRTYNGVRRGEIKQHYINKYINLFLNSYRFKNLDDKQTNYIMRKFWSEGCIGAFIVEGTKFNPEAPSVNNYPNGVIAFCPFAPTLYDIYDYPIQVQLVQSRGASFIPTNPLPVDTENGVIIGYIQKNKKPILKDVEYFIEKLVDIELTIRSQLKSHKVPWLIATTPENEARMKRLFERLDNDEEVLWLSADEVDLIKTLQGNNSYIIDKLYNFQQSINNELLTFLGKNNIGVGEKKEHLIGDEVNANNQVIEESEECFSSCLKEWSDKIKNIFHIDIGFECVNDMIDEDVEEDTEKENEEDDE